MPLRRNIPNEKQFTARINGKGKTDSQVIIFTLIPARKSSANNLTCVIFQSGFAPNDYFVAHINLCDGRLSANYYTTQWHINEV